MPDPCPSGSDGAFHPPISDVPPGNDLPDLRTWKLPGEATYLDALETSEEGFNPTSQFPDEPDPGPELCEGFRHSGWSVRRSKVAEAIRNTEGLGGRLNRFCHCGDAGWLMTDAATGQKLRLRLNRCRDRFCEPCAREKRQTVVNNLGNRAPTQNLRLLTLTLRSSDADLREQVKRLYKSFRTLRAGKLFKKRIRGGVFFAEITYNADTERWHPHLHVVFEGDFIPHAELSKAWQEITGDSFIVDIRRLRDSRAAAGYVAKYASKAIGGPIWGIPAALSAAVEALKGVHTFATFGTWRALQLSKPIADDEDWVPVMSLSRLLAAVRDGNETALLIYRRLRRYDVPEPIDDLTRSPPGRSVSDLHDSTVQ